MNTYLQIENKIQKISPVYLKELESFLEYLIVKSANHKKRYLKLNWASGLKKYKNKFSSIELQKKSLEWWQYVSD